jgi:hypothetical protein
MDRERQVAELERDVVEETSVIKLSGRPWHVVHLGPRTDFTIVDPHTSAHSFLSNGGTEGAMIRFGGWRAPDLHRRYGASMVDERAREAHRRLLPCARL